MTAVRRTLAAVLVVLGAALATGTTLTRIAAQGRPAPGWARAPASWSPAMLVAAGGQALAADDSRAAERDARRALARSPLDDRALELLVRALDAQGRWDEERLLLALSATLTRRNLPLRMMLATDAFAGQRWAEGVRDADLLLRQQAYPDQLFADLRDAAAVPAGRAAIVAQLAAAPAWRHDFLVDLRGLRPGGDDAQLAILLALRRTAAPPSPLELTAFARQAIGTGNVALAARLRQAFAPAPAGLLLDGSLARAGIDPAGVLGWALPDGGYRPADDRTGLSLETAGSGEAAWQVTFLPPGRYRLRWRARGIHPGPLTGLQWSLTCIGPTGGAGATLPLTTDAAAGQELANAATRLATVTGCAAQRLTLYYARNIEDDPAPQVEAVSLLPVAGGGEPTLRRRGRLG